MKFNDTLSVAKALEDKKMKLNARYFSDCVLLARYYITIGKTDSDIYSLLYNKIKNMDENWGGLFANNDTPNIIKVAKKLGKLQDYSIKFSKQELDYIHNFNSLPLEKILFIMFCAYKIEDKHRFEMKQSEAMKLANNSYTKKYADTLIGKILDDKSFEAKIYHSELIYYPTQKTLDLFDANNIVLEISDFRNLVYYYLDYINASNFSTCDNCNVIMIKTGKHQRFCPDCRKIFQNERSKDCMRKKRNQKNPC